MNDKQRQAYVVQDRIDAFVSSACAGDIEAIRAQVASGFDLNGTDHLGDTILEQVISQLELYPEAPKYQITREILRLGADPGALSQDGSSPLFTAVLNMDCEMVRLLLDAGANPNEPLRILLGAGADPNAVSMDAIEESLYDWAEFAYRYEVWNNKLPTDKGTPDRADIDAWLRHLARIAVKYGKRRPDHLQLLRQRGALSLSELRQAIVPEKEKGYSQPLNHLDRRLRISHGRRRDAGNEHPRC